MLRFDLTRLVQSAVDDLVEAGHLPAGLPEVELQDTKDPAHGDFATNFAMVAAKAAGMNPRALAEVVAEALHSNPTEPHPNAISAVDIAGPGFINLRLNPEFVASYVPGVAASTPPEFAARAAEATGEKHRINVEFVSVNPNGPITIGSGRGAAFGSTLASVLEAAGHIVHREYYINDGVNSAQMRLFAEAVMNSTDLDRPYARAEHVQLLTKQVQENVGAVQSYVDRRLEELRLQEARIDHDIEMYTEHPESSPWTEEITREEVDFLRLAKKGVASSRAALILAQNQLGQHQHGLQLLTQARIEIGGLPLEVVQDYVQGLMIETQREDLNAFGTTFDTWFSEQSLHDSGIVRREIAALVAKGAADDRPIRHKLKLAKGGVIEDVEIEEQASGQDPESPSPPEGEKGWDEGRPANDGFSPSPPNPLSPPRGEGEPEPLPPSGTLWLRSTKFGDDMDRVIRRKDGRLTYIASDIAYHKDKFNRPENADKLITVLGPDHHGYIGRLHAVLAAADYEEFPTTEEHWESEGGLANPAEEPRPLTDVEAKLYATAMERDACLYALQRARKELDVIIFQLVRFMKDGKPAPMRKRDGNIYALIDLIDEIGKKVKPEAPLEEQRKSGKDVARFFYLMRSHDTTFDFDLDLAEKQSEDNPVFYVQYAHARICSILKRSRDEGRGTEDGKSTFDPRPSTFSFLTHPKETALIKKILDLPYEVSRCGEDYGVHRLTTYAIELARAYHHFYDACRVIQPEEAELTKARLMLCEATKVALKATFDLLGIEAPEHM